MTYEQIIENIRKKIYHPIYFLTGEEPFYIDEIADILMDTVLSDIEKEFNLAILYGKDTDVNAIDGAARRYPMMSNYQVLIIREAQMLDKIEELERYTKAPLKSTILVLCYKYKKPDKRKKFFKDIEKNSVYFESPKIKDDKLPEWIKSYVKKKGYGISPEASALLAEYLGSDLGKVANETAKLMINLAQGTEISVSYIEKNIGITKEYSIFELQNALGRKDSYQANRIVTNFASNPKENPLIKTIILLYGYFLKVFKYHYLTDKNMNAAASVLSCSPYFVKDYEYASKRYSIEKLKQVIGILKEYNLKAIGINNNSTEQGELMKEMIFKILH